MFNALTVGALALSMLGAPIAGDPLFSDPVSPPGDKIVVSLITVNGSGCPAGTTAIAVSPDNTAFTVTYSAYLAQVGVGAKPTDSRKNCQLAVQVHVPQGFTYAIVSADYRGYGSLAKGANARAQANYYFQGLTPTTYASHDFSGPMDDNWQTTDKTEIGSLSWAPCGEIRYLNINTELRVNKGTSDTSKTTSFMSMDSTDGNISTIYHLQWQKCPKK